MGLGQYVSLGEYCGPHTASSVFLILLLFDAVGDFEKILKESKLRVQSEFGYLSNPVKDRMNNDKWCIYSPEYVLECKILDTSDFREQGSTTDKDNSGLAGKVLLLEMLII